MAFWQRMKVYFTLPGDTPDAVLRKIVLTLFFGAVTAAAVIPITRLSTGTYPLKGSLDILFLVGFGLCIVCFATLMVRRQLPAPFLFTFMLFALLLAVLMDIRSFLQGSERAWPFMVVMIDLVWFLDLPEVLPNIIGGVMAVLIPLLALEQEYSIGIRDLESFEDIYCKCDNPPCPGGLLSQVRPVSVVLFIFFIDLALTKRFAKGMREEKTKVIASVDVASKIAHALTRFDLAQAGLYLSEADGLPDDLANAFVLLIQNLNTYRPYLPESCFCGSSSDEASVTQVSETTHEGSVTSPMSAHESWLERRSSTNSTVVAMQAQVISRKMVSIVVVTVKNYLAKVDQETLTSFQRDWVTSSLKVIRGCRGVLDEFNGDRLMVNFNGSRACSTYNVSSLRCAFQLSRLRDDQAIGVSSGKALCGSLGNDEVRRYSIIGLPTVRARITASLAEAWNIPVIAPERVVQEAVGMVVARLLVERIQFSTEKTGVGGAEPTSAPTRVYEVCREATCGEDEWMYQLQFIHEADPYVRLNACLARAMDGGCVEECIESLKELGPVAASTVVALGQYDILNKALPIYKVSDFSLVAVSSDDSHGLLLSST